MRAFVGVRVSGTIAKHAHPTPRPRRSAAAALSGPRTGLASASRSPKPSSRATGHAAAGERQPRAGRRSATGRGACRQASRATRTGATPSSWTGCRMAPCSSRRASATRTRCTGSPAPAGAREQLTFYPEPITPRRAANRERRQRLRVPEGQGRRRERSDLSLPRGRQVDAPADGRQVEERQPVWSHDGKRARVLQQRARRRELRHLRRRRRTRTRRRASRSPASRTPGIVLDWSPDDTKLLLWQYVSINESYLFVADVSERHAHAARRRCRREARQR